MTSIMSTSGKPGIPGPRADIRKRLMVKRPANPTREEAVAFGAEGLQSIAYPDPKRLPDAPLPTWRVGLLTGAIIPSV